MKGKTIKKDVIFDKLIAFDMDSTLIQCEVIDEIAKHNKVYDQVSKITEKAMKGEIDFNTSLKERVHLLKGTPLSYLENFKKNLPYSSGLKELITYLKKNQYRIIILSGGFDLFANEIKNQFNLDGLATNRLEIKDYLLTGNLLGEIINAEKKAFYLKEFASKFNIDISQTAAVGDGANDLLMLKTSSIGIAFNAKKVVRDQTRFSVDNDDLSNIIPILKEN